MTELWLLRHAETDWSATGRHTGRTDVPLTDTGREAARALRARMADVQLDAVFVSPLARARETAELAGLLERPDVRVRDDLLEFDYGDYEGRTTPEIREERPGWTVWADGSPGGETPADVGARVDRVIDEALVVGGTCAIVAHGHVLRVLAARWLEQPAAFGARLALATGRLGILGFERETRALQRWNA